MGRLCEVDGCDRDHRARGMCDRHYQRWAKSGDPGVTSRIVGDDVARFWSKVDKSEGCWLWTGPRNHQGYGKFAVGGRDDRRHVAAHQYVYDLLVGTVPAGLQLDHTCHDPASCNLGVSCPHRQCVNPAHLKAVTPKENQRRRAELVVACPQGHPYDAENTRITKKGFRACRECDRVRSREYQCAKRANRDRAAA